MDDASAPKTTASSWDPVAPAPTTEKERGFIAELLIFSWENKWWWIIPTLLILSGLGVLVIAAGSSRFAPFIYALF